MPGVRLDCSTYVFGNLSTCGSFTEKFDVLFPGKRHQNAHLRGKATIEEPARRGMINPDNVQTCFAHQRQIGIHLFTSTAKISTRIRFERTVCEGFDEKLFVSVEKELRLGSDSRVCGRCHLERSRDISQPIKRKRFVQRSHKAAIGQATSPFGCPTPTRLVTKFFDATARC